MIGFGSGTFYKMVVKEDGSPNWIGIGILTTVFVVVFVWRCCVFIPEYWVATRRRFNRVVRDKNDMPREYDPLAMQALKPVRRWQLFRLMRRQLRRWRHKPELTFKKVRGFRFRFYMINSLVLVNCGKRETNLDIDAITLGDIDFDTSFSAAWNVSRERGNPTKSFLKPAESKWRWKSEKDELEQLVRKYVADAVLRAYEAIGESLTEVAPTQLPLLDFETNSYVTHVKEFLLEEYGVDFTGILYGRRSVSPARRALQGYTALAEANRDIASAIRGDIVHPAASGERAAAAAAIADNVFTIHPPSPSA